METMETDINTNQSMCLLLEPCETCVCVCVCVCVHARMCDTVETSP